MLHTLGLGSYLNRRLKFPSLAVDVNVYEGSELLGPNAECCWNAWKGSPASIHISGIALNSIVILVIVQFFGMIQKAYRQSQSGSTFADEFNAAAVAVCCCCD